MDQACAFGATPVLMTYDGDVVGVEGAAVGAPLHYLLVDLRASKDTVVILEQLQVGWGGPGGGWLAGWLAACAKVLYRPGWAGLREVGCRWLGGVAGCGWHGAVHSVFISLRAAPQPAPPTSSAADPASALHPPAARHARPRCSCRAC